MTVDNGVDMGEKSFILIPSRNNTKHRRSSRIAFFMSQDCNQFEVDRSGDKSDLRSFVSVKVRLDKKSTLQNQCFLVSFFTMNL